MLFPANSGKSGVALFLCQSRRGFIDTLKRCLQTDELPMVIKGGNTEFIHHLPGLPCPCGQVCHDCVQCVSRFTAFDASVCEYAERCGGVLNGNVQALHGSADANHGFHQLFGGLVGRVLRSCGNVEVIGQIPHGHTRGGHGVRDQVRAVRQVHPGSLGHLQDGRKGGYGSIHVPSGEAHVFQSVGGFRGGLGCGSPHLHRRRFHFRVFLRVGVCRSRRRGHRRLKFPSDVHGRRSHRCQSRSYAGKSGGGNLHACAADLPESSEGVQALLRSGDGGGERLVKVSGDFNGDLIFCASGQVRPPPSSPSQGRGWASAYSIRGCPP